MPMAKLNIAPQGHLRAEFSLPAAKKRGQILALLGDSLSSLGQVGRARACREDALRIFESLGTPEADAMRVRLVADQSGSLPG